MNDKAGQEESDQQCRPEREFMLVMFCRLSERDVEEKAADEKLSSLAEEGINQEAAGPAHQENDDEELTAPVSARSKSSRSAAGVKARR